MEKFRVPKFKLKFVVLNYFMKPIFIFTPPFTQLNTPYPASAYIKGFLNTQNIDCFQADLGIEVILKLFSKDGLKKMFKRSSLTETKSENAQRIEILQNDYISTIDEVIKFLQGKNPTLALSICQEDFLPEASRFQQLEDIDWAFGTMGTQDRAKHLATLYLEDLSDYIVECVDVNFGFSRYAERLGRSANKFDEIYSNLQQPNSFIDELLIELLQHKILTINPELVMISVPFPGNLFAAFRSAQYLKKHFPEIKIALGGGFPNTELRSISDTRVFELIDFISLDDGERPTLNIIEYLHGKRAINDLKRTFALIDGKVVYCNNGMEPDFKQNQVGTPDYSNLLLDQYISVIEVVNPMHKMWSDGRWNKLTMAHGCYWGKCTFCDISLDYIKIYEPVAANLICDRIEELIESTGQTGFHFVDEAAPPALMRAVALEILKRKLSITWWTNIRFEKTFSADLCKLLKASGCIAVSGGLEVASDRLLQLIDKGVTVGQVANVTQNFTQAGIMVHAYLMYGYPTQTIQETVDSLEMVRQLFELGIVQSGFWHQFALTAHSPVGLNPEQFGVEILNKNLGTFANNDLEFVDKTRIDHGKFSFGLKKSLFNFMHGICFDYPLQDWFEFKIPRTTIRPNYIENAINQEQNLAVKDTAKVVWLGQLPIVSKQIVRKKGIDKEISILSFHSKVNYFQIKMEAEIGIWLISILKKNQTNQVNILSLGQIKKSYEEAGLGDFNLFLYSKNAETLRENGWLFL